MDFLDLFIWFEFAIISEFRMLAAISRVDLQLDRWSVSAWFHDVVSVVSNWSGCPLQFPKLVVCELSAETITQLSFAFSTHSQPTSKTWSDSPNGIGCNVWRLISERRPNRRLILILFANLVSLTSFKMQTLKSLLLFKPKSESCYYMQINNGLNAFDRNSLCFLLLCCICFSRQRLRAAVRICFSICSRTLSDSSLSFFERGRSFAVQIEIKHKLN